MTELTIQQTAEKTGASIHTLRYYERIGLISPIKRAPNGHRRYSPKDVSEIVFLTRLRAVLLAKSVFRLYALRKYNRKQKRR